MKAPTIERFLNMNTAQSEPDQAHLTFTYEDIEASQYSNIQVSHFTEIQLEQVGYSDSQSNQMNFSEDESDNEKLIQLHLYFKKDKNKWKKIFQEYNGKYSIQKLKQMYKKIKNENKIWTIKEQQRLIHFIKEKVNLDEIQKEFPEKSAKSLQKMFLKLKRNYFEESKFTIIDDQKLLELVARFGKKWKIISKYFHEKSLNQLKNRFYSVLLKIQPKNQEKYKPIQRCRISILPSLPKGQFYNYNIQIISSISENIEQSY